MINEENKLKKKKELLIEITNKCPFNCIFCSSNSNILKNSFIDKKKVINIIKDAKDLGFEIIQLSGGEPFLHPNIIDFIDYVLENDLFLEIYTCGSISQDRNYLPIPEKIIRRYANHPNLTFRYNFQTINMKNFEKLTGSSFGLNNLITSIKTCKKYNIKIEVHIVPNCLNIKDLENTIDFLINDLKINHIKILRLILHGRALENYEKLVFSEKDLHITLSRITKRYIMKEVEIGSAFSELSNSCITCQAAKDKYMITCDLKLFPCTAFKNKTACYIKINKEVSFKKVYRNKHLKIKLQYFKEYLKCGYCRKIEICKEICPIQKMVCYKVAQLDIIKQYIKSKVPLENITL